MKTYKVTAPLSIIGRNRSRRFERDEQNVTEAEVESLIDYIRTCFEETPVPPAPPALVK